MIEAKKLAYADMLRYVGDPRFAKIPVAELLSQARAANAGEAHRHGEGRVRRSSRDRSTGLTNAAGQRHDLPVASWTRTATSCR